MKLAAILALAILLAGCSGKPSDGADPPPPDGEQGNGGETGVPSETDPTSTPNRVSFNECVGMGATLSYYGNLADIDSGQTPTGWESDIMEDHRYFFMVNRCERVAVGPFERGPITFLIEAHGGVQAPQKCIDFEDGADDFKVLLGIWLDDPEIATYLRDALGMPAQTASFETSVTPQDDQELHQWTWSSGDDMSTVVGVHPGGTVGTSSYLDRFVWHNGTGVTFLDLQEDTILSYSNSPPAAGVLAPPMAYGQGLARPFTGLTSVWKQADHYGPIFRFGDLQCGQFLD